MGSDGSSLFVQGYGQMYTARYRQTGLVETPAAALPAPTGLSATALSQSRVQLRWTNNAANQTAVSVERCVAPCTSFAEVARLAGSATSVIDKGLAPGTSYSYRVRASNGTSWSPYSTSVTVTPSR